MTQPPALGAAVTTRWVIVNAGLPTRAWPMFCALGYVPLITAHGFLAPVSAGVSVPLNGSMSVRGVRRLLGRRLPTLRFAELSALQGLC